GYDDPSHQARPRAATSTHHRTHLRLPHHSTHSSCLTRRARATPPATHTAEPRHPASLLLEVRVPRHAPGVGGHPLRAADHPLAPYPTPDSCAGDGEELLLLPPWV